MTASSSFSPLSRDSRRIELVSLCSAVCQKCFKGHTHSHADAGASGMSGRRDTVSPLCSLHYWNFNLISWRATCAPVKSTCNTTARGGESRGSRVTSGATVLSPSHSSTSLGLPGSLRFFGPPGNEASLLSYPWSKVPDTHNAKESKFIWAHVPATVGLLVLRQKRHGRGAWRRRRGPPTTAAQNRGEEGPGTRTHPST